MSVLAGTALFHAAPTMGPGWLFPAVDEEEQNLEIRPPAHLTPPMLPRENVTIDDISGRWWLTHTKPRNEKALAWNLLDAGIDYFLPLARLSRTYGRHRQEVVLPLFSGYMFCACASEDDRFAVMDTGRVANLVEVFDQALLRSELEQIRRALETPHEVDLFPGIKSGRRCESLPAA